MVTLTKEEIDQQIKEVPFNSVEEIIGELAKDAGRHGLVHRELRSFSAFIVYMIWAEKEDYEDKYCPFSFEFKESYVNFYPYGERTLDDDEALYRWACLYYIHETEYADWSDDDSI